MLATLLSSGESGAAAVARRLVMSTRSLTWLRDHLRRNPEALTAAPYLSLLGV
jgi:hypothetical protein